MGKYPEGNRRKLSDQHRYGANFEISLSLWDYLFKKAYTEKDGTEVILGFEGDDLFPTGFWGQASYGFMKREQKNGEVHEYTRPKILQ